MRKWIVILLAFVALVGILVVTPPSGSSHGSSECSLSNTASSMADAQIKLNAYQTNPPAGGEAIICFEGNYSYDSTNSIKFDTPWSLAKLRIIGTGSGAIFTLQSSDSSGFIEVTNSNPTYPVTIVFENVTLDGNLKNGLIAKATEFGRLEIEVINSVVKSYLRASGRTGPIYGSDISITSSTIRNNTASEAGGAVYALGSITINNSNFINNTSSGTNFQTDGGGAIYARADVTVDEGTFSGNVSNISGGAIWTSGETNVSDSTFTSNQASSGGNGGAIVSSGTVLINRSTFTQNNTTRTNGTGNGGAIWAGSLGQVFYSTFSQNAALNGGAIFSSNLNLANSTFANNQATAEGGALYVLGGNILFSTFYENQAAPYTDPNNDVPGNAVYKEDDDDLYIGGNIFVGSDLYPQIGVGSVVPTPVIDTGGNVFSSTRSEEIDIVQAQNLEYLPSLYERSVLTVFGSNSLANNGGPTETILLGAGSPALCAAGNVTLGSPDVRAYDQRGIQRTNPFDSGSVQVTSPGTGCGSLANTGPNLFMPLLGITVLLLISGLSLLIFRKKYEGKIHREVSPLN